MPKVFISYVREYLNEIKRLVKVLEENGIDVRIDLNIKPGVRWRNYIRKEIKQCDYFLAFFSEAYSLKSKTYMNEEIILAIEQLRLRSIEDGWFIPVKITKCELPDREIGCGETLNSVQWIDLSYDWM